MKKLEGKVAIITGASSGLGKQIAFRFAEEGAKLALCARTESKLLETKKQCEELGAEVMVMPVDLCNYNNLDTFVNAVIEKFGTVDILINNAVSISSPHPFIEHSIDELNQTIQSGLYATWQLMLLCFPYMKEHGGSIVNFGSGAGRKGMPGYAAYAATKEAIRGLTRVVANEWGQYGIRANICCPSAVTDNVKASMDYLPEDMKQYVQASLSQNALCRPGDPYEDITPVVLFLASDDSRWLTGECLNPEGGGDIHC